MNAITSGTDSSSTPTVLMELNPSLLLAASPTIAYSFATVAAANNDVAVLRAFLDAGLDPTISSHSVKRAGGAKFVVSPWMKAVENDCVECAQLMLACNKSRKTRLLGMRPGGRSTLVCALDNESDGILKLFIRSNNLPPPPRPSDFDARLASAYERFKLMQTLAAKAPGDPLAFSEAPSQTPLDKPVRRAMRL